MTDECLRFITHPEVDVQPDVPVTQWHLSSVGLRRAQALTDLDWWARIGSVFSSDERKAVETASIVTSYAGRPATVLADLGENGRSATGYLPAEEFERTADRFFAEPGRSVRGWETANAAQQRIVAAVGKCLDAAAGADVAIVSHGGVGTLLLCHLAGVPIDRRLDQPGQGSYFCVDRHTMAVVHGWMRIPLPAPK